MRLLFLMFVTAVCVLFLLKLRWPKTKSTFVENYKLSLCFSVEYMVWEIFNWHRIFKSDFAVIRCWNKLISKICRVKFVSHFLVNVAVIQSFLRHSCWKIRLVPSEGRGRARPLTAFVASTTRSIKLHKGKNFWHKINSISLRSIFVSIAYVQTLPLGEGGVCTQATWADLHKDPT